MRATPDVARATPTSARRRRERRIRSFFRHEQMAVQMAVVSAQHHSAQRCRSIANQTDDSLPAATYAATASAAATYAATAASPMVEYVDPAPVVTYAAPAPVIEYIAPAPAMTYVAFSQQLLPAYTITTDTTDDNFDNTDLVHTQFSSTAVETFAPQVVVSIPPCEEFSAPVYDQVNQEQNAAGETTENIAEIPVVQEQVTVQDIPEVVDSLPPVEEFTEPGYHQVHHEQIVAGEMTQNIIGNSAVQEQAIVQEIPPDVEQIQEQIIETIDNEPSSTSTSSSSTSTIRDDIVVLLNSFHNMEKEVERAAMLTKRMMETPLPQPPMPEPPMMEPPLIEPDRTSAKRRRRTRYTPLPRIMENAVYLAPNAWPPIRHA